MSGLSNDERGGGRGEEHSLDELDGKEGRWNDDKDEEVDALNGELELILSDKDEERT